LIENRVGARSESFNHQSKIINQQSLFFQAITPIRNRKWREISSRAGGLAASERICRTSSGT
jgi:hypothetical protein